jgi:hypothetical protein
MRSGRGLGAERRVLTVNRGIWRSIEKTLYPAKTRFSPAQGFSTSPSATLRVRASPFFPFRAYFEGLCLERILLGAW